MDEFRGQYHGNLTLTSNLAVYGLIEGAVTVPSNIRLNLHGMITGDLIVQKDGVAIIHGTVVGTVINEDATVEVFGTVGDVRNSGSRQTSVRSGAVVLKPLLQNKLR